MKLFTEDQILDQGFRAQVIAEIMAPENVARKREAKKRYDLYKDKTKKYVLENLKKEGLFDETIAQMENRASNISILKKVVDKRARAYVGGVTRETESETKDIQIAALTDYLDYDSKMKKSDRFRDLYKNCAIYFVPENEEMENGKLGLKMMVLSPWQYDAIEDATDREKARVIVLSDFSETANFIHSPRTESDAKLHDGPIASSSDGIDNVIADHHTDAGADDCMTFTWWSDNYHFVTGESGAINGKMTPREDRANPIEILPFTTIAEDQDGEFWAEGGEDLVEGSILVNTIITDMFYIARLQGYGQTVITGKNLPATLAIGPNNALIMEYDPAKEDPKPEFEIVSATPPIDQWLKSIEQYIALLLTTNNLSTSSVKMSLDGQSFPSGIAMVIDMAEVSSDISDNREQFSDVEKRNIFIVTRWINYLNDQSFGTKAMSDIGTIDPDIPVTTRFHELKATITEAEKLENLKKRKELGINEMVDLIMIDNPDMTPEQATKKLANIMREKVEQISSAMIGNIKTEDKDIEDE